MSKSKLIGTGVIAALYLVVLLALTTSLAGCSESSTPVASKADRNDIRVSVEWVAATKIDAVCKAAGAADGQHFEACAASGATACTIYAVQPRHFGDKSGLQALGHEAWHCFGARH